MIWYSLPKASTQKLINHFSKVARYKINIQKFVAFLYTNDEISDGESKKKTFKIIFLKKLVVKLTKDIKDLYIENYKTLIKEIGNDLKKWKNIPYFWIERINIIKMTIESKSIYRFNAINPYQNTHDIFHRAKTNNSKIYMEHKRSSCQNKPEKKEKNWRYDSSRPQSTLQSYSNQNSKVLVQKT